MNITRHNTYMDQLHRKAKSLEQLKAENPVGTDKKMVHVSEGVFVDENELVNPSDEVLLKLAGGEVDMIHTGKKGVELRTVLAHRVILFIPIIILIFINGGNNKAVHIKQRLYEKAVAKGLAKHKDTFWRREIYPLFAKIYEGSSSDSDDEDPEEMKKRKKEEMRKLKKEQRKADHDLKDMLLMKAKEKLQQKNNA